MKQSLAVIAVLFLLLRPLCEVQAAGPTHGAPSGDAHASAVHAGFGGDPHGNDLPCCANLEDGALLKVSDSAATRTVGETNLAFTAPSWTTAHYLGAPGADARHPPGIPFSPSSYYARSARIQR
jgi:hypothetical protein